MVIAKFQNLDSGILHVPVGTAQFLLVVWRPSGSSRQSRRTRLDVFRDRESTTQKNP